MRTTQQDPQGRIDAFERAQTTAYRPRTACHASGLIQLAINNRLPTFQATKPTWTPHQVSSSSRPMRRSTRSSLRPSGKCWTRRPRPRREVRPFRILSARPNRRLMGPITGAQSRGRLSCEGWNGISKKQMKLWVALERIIASSTVANDSFGCVQQVSQMDIELQGLERNLKTKMQGKLRGYRADLVKAKNEVVRTASA